MQRLLKLVLAAGALSMGSTLAAQALPSNVGHVGGGSAQASLVERVHGCHRDAEPGRYGWHYHRGRHCERHYAEPPRRHYYREHRRDYGHRRGPRCYQDCKYVGPIKVCKERCR